MKLIFLRYLLTCILFITVSNFCYTQTTGNLSSDSIKTKEDVINSLRSGQWSILFGIGSDFNLTNFDDALIAIKYNISSKSALRLDLNMNYYNSKNSDYDYIELQEQAYGGNLSYLYYINPRDRFNIYLSLGVNYSYNDNYYTLDDGFYRKISTWQTGPKAGAGAEFFVFTKMSLFAEYNYILGFGKVEDEFGNYFASFKRNSDITSLQKDNVKFGLSVYF